MRILYILKSTAIFGIFIMSYLALTFAILDNLAWLFGAPHGPGPILLYAAIASTVTGALLFGAMFIVYFLLGEQRVRRLGKWLYPQPGNLPR